MTHEQAFDPHLSERTIACYVDRTLAPDDREAAERHLAECAECREEVAAVVALLRRPRATRWYVLGPGVAAAAAILVVALLPRGSTEPVTPRLRTDGAEGVATIQAVAPAAGDTVAATDLLLLWRPVGPDARYRIRVTTADGSAVWAHSTVDTSATPPDSIAFAPGETYFWFTDALLPDGRSATTGIRRFVVHP